MRGIAATKAAAGRNSPASFFSSDGPSITPLSARMPSAKLTRLPPRMMRPVMNGKVPASTPALDQPMPFCTLDAATAAPNAPVSWAVAASRPRREIMDAASVRHQPALVRRDLVDALDILVHEFVERRAAQECVGLRGPLDIFLPLRRGLNLLHEVDIEGDLLGRDFAGQPDGARLLELHHVQSGFHAGRNVVPALRGGDLGADGKALR